MMPHLNWTSSKYGYLRKSISIKSSIFQVTSSHIKNKFFCVVTQLANSAQPRRQQKRVKWATWLKWQWDHRFYRLDRGFIINDRRDFDFVGNTQYIGSHFTSEIEKAFNFVSPKYCRKQTTIIINNVNISNHCYVCIFITIIICFSPYLRMIINMMLIFFELQ